MHTDQCLQIFRALHDAQRGFLLPNAWDAASARLFEAAGFAAIGTTSGGIAYARCHRDGQRLSRGAMLREIASLVAAVSVPVTADIEAGYGDAPAEVALTVQGVLNTGAVGINLEDRTGNGALYAVVDQQRRLDAARASGGNIVINAGTDTYLVSFGITQEERYAETVRRGRAYVEAGADVVFVPGVVESVLARRLVADLGGPVNLMLMPGAPAAGDLLDCGVQRVSTGPAIMLATLGLVARVARELREDGTSARLDEYFYGFSEAEALFTA